MKIPRSNVQFLRRDAIDDDNDPTKKTDKPNPDNSQSTENSVNFELEEEEEDTIDDDQDQETPDEFGESLNSEEIKELQASKTRRRTRSMTAVERRELERDPTTAFWLQIENTECFDDVAVYAVEVSAKEHKKPEVVEAKDK